MGSKIYGMVSTLGKTKVILLDYHDQDTFDIGDVVVIEKVPDPL